MTWRSIRRNSCGRCGRKWREVTWPSRKETLVTTGLVFAMVALAAMFFFLVDQVIGIGIRALFGMSA